jgi:putative Mg2+ transporter-C (MgtC) family protein
MNPDIYIYPLTSAGIGTALLCGFLIGVERQLKGKPAGIRTSMLVTLGAYVFISISSAYTGDGSPTRVLGQIVSGIGFLGAGIILAKDGLIHGVTSAAIIWMLAGIGSMIGIGNYLTAIILSVIVLFVLVFVSLLEKWFKKLKTGLHKD